MTTLPNLIPEPDILPLPTQRTELCLRNKSTTALARAYPVPTALLSLREVMWNEDEPIATNLKALGCALARVGDTYRHPEYLGGLLLAPEMPGVECRTVRNSKDLAALLADRVRLRYCKGGNERSCRLPAQCLEIALRSEIFLCEFPPVDLVVPDPMFLTEEFTLTQPGYSDGGPDNRVLFTGPAPEAGSDTTTIDTFLDVMAFASESDRTHAVAAALTVLLRNHWPGGKPLVAVTATKSHAGKDTVIAFACSSTRQVAVDYQKTDWAFRQGLVAALQSEPAAGVVNVCNARLAAGDQELASATLERILTDSDPVLHSTKERDGVKLRGRHLVYALSTNFGSLSIDLLNRALPIHLNPVGDVVTRSSTIGNPKLEYLPQDRDRIVAELLGLVERWKAAGKPLASEVTHPYLPWARTIGGILKVAGYKGFLANLGRRTTESEPLRRGLGLLGAAQPNKWLKASAWVQKVVSLGLVKDLIPANERETDTSRMRGLGVVLTKHRQETFVVETETGTIRLRLEKKRARFQGSEPCWVYRFVRIQGNDADAVGEEAIDVIE